LTARSEQQGQEMSTWRIPSSTSEQAWAHSLCGIIQLVAWHSTVHSIPLLKIHPQAKPSSHMKTHVPLSVVIFPKTEFSRLFADARSQLMNSILLY